MNLEKIRCVSALLWKDIWNTSGDYFSGIREKNSGWYQSFSELSLELGSTCIDSYNNYSNHRRRK